MDLMPLRLWDNGVTQGIYRKFYADDEIKEYRPIHQEKLVRVKIAAGSQKEFFSTFPAKKKTRKSCFLYPVQILDHFAPIILVGGIMIVLSLVILIVEIMNQRLFSSTN